MRSKVMMCAVISASILPVFGAQKLAGPVAIVKATLMEMAPDPGILSGTVAVYRFARYRVDGVCSGRYAEKEIVVGHLVPLDSFVGNTKPGDSLVLSIRKSARPLTSPSEAAGTNLSRRNDVRWIARPASAVEQKACVMLK